jgi:hypothetical protein
MVSGILHRDRSLWNIVNQTPANHGKEIVVFVRRRFRVKPNSSTWRLTESDFSRELHLTGKAWKPMMPAIVPSFLLYWE